MPNALAARLEAVLRKHDLVVTRPARASVVAGPPQPPSQLVVAGPSTAKMAYQRFQTIEDCLAAKPDLDEDGNLAAIIEQQSWPLTLPYSAGNYTIEDAQRVEGGFLVHLSGT